jgi:hypothetical protein
MKMFKLEKIAIGASILWFICYVSLIIIVGYFAIKGIDYIQKHGLKPLVEQIWKGDSKEED